MELDIRNWMLYGNLSHNFGVGRVAVLTGPTGAGKSSILDAVEWAFTGTAYNRGVLKAKDATYFRGDPTKPMSVSATFARPPEGWPQLVQRASKLSIHPEAVADGFKGRADQIAAALQAWSFVRLKVDDRAALLGAISRVVATTDEILVELRKHTPAPPPAKYNELEWGGFHTVPEALEQAEAIRRSYYAAARASVPAEWEAELSAKRAAALAIKVPAKPEPPQGINARNGEMVKEITGEMAALEALAKFYSGLKKKIPPDWIPDRRQGVTDWLDDLLTREALEPHAKKQEILDAVKKQAEADAEAQGIFDKAFGEWSAAERQRIEVSGQIDVLEGRIADVGKNAKGASTRYTSWDGIIKALAPDGETAVAMARRATKKIDHDRLKWGSDLLRIGVTLSEDGSLRILGRSEQMPSRGERLLAALLVQDAVLQVAEIPVALVDELESLDPDCLARALTFLDAVADDYETVLACYTGPFPRAALTGLEATDAYNVQAGKLTRLP